MITLFPPAKRLKEEKIKTIFTPTTPIFENEAFTLVKKLQTFSKKKIKEVMKVSDDIAKLNYNRFKNYQEIHTSNNSYPAIFLYNGDTHQQVDQNSYSKNDFEYAEKNTYIISGLYGLVRPTDFIQPYRLEMGRVVSGRGYKDLYHFWEDKIAKKLNNDLKNHKDKTILNVSSQEYGKVINPEKINGKVIEVIFQEKRDGTFKTIGILAKKARGMMVDWIITSKVSNHEKVKEFSRDSYKFNKKLSTENTYIFTR